MSRRGSSLLALFALPLLGTVSALEARKERHHANRRVLERLRGGALTLPPVLHYYKNALAAAPICTNVISAAGLSLLADGMTQTLERRMQKHTADAAEPLRRLGSLC